MPVGICPARCYPPSPSPCDNLRITQSGSSYRGGENEEEEEEEAKQYQEFQKRQVQSLLELREAQADTEAERRLEHLRQVRWAGGHGGRPASWTHLASAWVTRWPPVSAGSAAAQGDCPGGSHNSDQEAEGGEREVKAEDLVGVGWGLPCSQRAEETPGPAVDPFSAPRPALPGRRRNCRRFWTGSVITVSQRPRQGRNIRRRRKGPGARSRWGAGSCWGLGRQGWGPGTKPPLHRSLQGTDRD